MNSCGNLRSRPTAAGWPAQDDEAVEQGSAQVGVNGEPFGHIVASQPRSSAGRGVQARERQPVVHQRARVQRDAIEPDLVHRDRLQFRERGRTRIGAGNRT
jgi:hypothetical protein